MGVVTRVGFLALIVLLAASACGGGHSSTVVPQAESQRATASLATNVTSTSDAPVVAVNAGGAASGGFSGDQFFLGYSGTNRDAQPVDVTEPNTAPAAVYATYRTAPKTLTYAVTHLIAGAPYHGFLYFDEPLLGGAGRRVMSVGINGAVVIPAIDIFAVTGQTHKGIAVPIAGNADASGTFTIVLTALVNDTIISGFALFSGVAPAIRDDVWINSGGPAAGFFQPDTDFVGYSGANADPVQVGFGGPNAGADDSPEIYEDYRTAPKSLTYAVPNLNPNTTYHGLLYFEEPLLGGVGRRVMSVRVGTTVITPHLDIFAQTGKTHVALALPFASNPDVTGTLHIVLTALANDTIISGFELHPFIFATPSPAPSASSSGIGGTVTEFTIPNGGTDVPQGIAAGPDGALWFTQFTTSRIGRVTTSGTFTEFALPANSAPNAITSGPDGALWFTDVNGAIGRITTGGAVTRYQLAPQSNPDGIVAGPDGALWFTERNANAIGRITTSGSISLFQLASKTPQPASITVGPDGTLWFTENSLESAGHITTGGIVTELGPGFGNARLPFSNQVSPEGIVTGPDGALWIADDLGAVHRLTTSGEFMTFPASNGFSKIASGPDGALYFPGRNSIDRITTGGSITEYPLPAANDAPLAIVGGPDGAVWFTEGPMPKIGRLR